MALKELGLSLTQARRLLDGITLDELHGMLMLRRAQLEHELLEHRNQLLGIEARLRHLAREGAMPADDIVVKKIPATGVVVIAGKAPAFGPAASIFPVVYHDPVRWIDERGYRALIGSNREVWVNEVDDIADVAQQVFEIQLPFTRPGPPELRAERRMIAAWRRAADLRDATELRDAALRDAAFRDGAFRDGAEPASWYVPD